MMVDAATGAIADAGGRARQALQAVHVIRGIWPYQDPGRLVADRLGLDSVVTGLTEFGGNGVFDLVNELAASISTGELDAALICSAETMRTRRADRRAGKTSAYLPEADGSSPDQSFGSARPLSDEADRAAGVDHASNFYALSEVALRHRRQETAERHRDRIAGLWERASRVASRNPAAWITEPRSAEEIATVSPANRMIAAPYPKLMTSNINVDQAAAVVLMSAGAASAAGISPGRIVPLWSGAGAHDHWITRTRWALDESPALRLAGRRALELAGRTVEEVELLDLYSCFPVAVEVAQTELGVDVDRDFTITGGLTFAGGPLNCYCMHSLCRAVDLIRGGAESALVTGNGGYFTKHSFTVLGSEPAPSGFRLDRPQAAVDALPRRPATSLPPASGTIESYTVTYDSAGEAERAIVAVLDSAGVRTWTNTQRRDTIDVLLAADHCGTPALVTPAEPESAPEVHLP